MFSFVHKIVLFGAFPRAKNRALDRAFWCSPSCQKPCSRSYFLVLSLVPKIVLFGALLRALLSFVQTSCSGSCFLVLSFVNKFVFFVVVPRSKNRAFWCSPSCQKPCSRSCFLVLSFVPKILLFGALPRATNRAFCAFPRAKNRALDGAFWCSPSCQKSCSRSCSLLQLLGLCQYICMKNMTKNRYIPK